MKKLENKIALVTGASKGIGAAIALYLAAEGAEVIVNYASSKEGAEKVVNDIKTAGGKAVTIQADLSQPSQLETLFVEIKKQFGKLDILVNNAGIYEFAPLEAITEEHFHKQFNVNVLGLILTTQKAVALFDSNGGNIINISSVVSHSPLENATVYSATKAAVDAITKSLSKELGSRKIRINSILPGIIETEGSHTANIIGSEMQDQIVSRTPLERIGQPNDIAKVAVFLASDDAGWITGETIITSGGLIG